MICAGGTLRVTGQVGNLPQSQPSAVGALVLAPPPSPYADQQELLMRFLRGVQQHERLFKIAQKAKIVPDAKKYDDVLQRELTVEVVEEGGVTPYLDGDVIRFPNGIHQTLTD